MPNYKHEVTEIIGRLRGDHGLIISKAISNDLWTPNQAKAISIYKKKLLSFVKLRSEMINYLRKTFSLILQKA